MSTGPMDFSGYHTEVSTAVSESDSVLEWIEFE